MRTVDARNCVPSATSCRPSAEIAPTRSETNNAIPTSRSCDTIGIAAKERMSEALRSCAAIGVHAGLATASGRTSVPWWSMTRVRIGAGSVVAE